MTATRSQFDADQARALALAATGDEKAFMSFYDGYCGDVFALELCRARARGVRDDRVRPVAEAMTESRFVTAWTRAGQQPSSGLGPLAWLLSLDVALASRSESRVEEAVCA